MKASRIEPAQRVSMVKEYYFSKKLKEVARLNAEGRDIISLGIGGPDRPPHARVVDTLCEYAHRSDTHGYQPYVGPVELRQAYADWYRRWYGVELNPANEIQPLIGSKEGILHITLAFVNPGDGVLVPNPGYPTYTSVSRLAGAEIFTYNLKEENAWYPDFDELESMPLDRIKLMWVNYPNMPTGAPATHELYEKIVDFGRRHNILIVNDNPYSFILNDNPISMLSVEGAKDVVIEMNSLSKSHNMAGWRMAMLASNAQFVEWVLKVKSNIDSGQFRPAMLAAVEALKCDSDWFDELNAVYARRRRVAERIMDALGCTFDPRQRGLFLWGKIPDAAESSEKFADNILYNARVFITPGFIFGSNGERFIRISLCATEEKMEEALTRIKQTI
ncbi:MAG: aminotransferase class I/II-fold pyridoxal phosphate-dependent enzyme [Candidatus Limisoma sp.]|nr:aminotransferase class I/II-fold pyridoxal phosphate-dependent enzyme [Bacteroidales bacterium]MDD7760434.1 aminotransferase class I/II-fold pyridoxal phosphate-dependent enzyme [Bacteroidales bacterium]MDY5894240.1 aminotransferase class I/II-fold pyridoxal phosphate-dependent enzyme [Candidatus Limisoma sp.]MDY5899819.1 aminotransferase class I/II-fold pyridoxal phosphate-dependent enzyme [Candidatus Limisoma sp.]